MVKSSNKHNHVANLNLILNHLRKSTPDGGNTAEELAILCQVTKRNIYRYFNEIEHMGFELIRPVQSKPGMSGAGRYALKKRVLPETRIDTNIMMLLGLYAEKHLHYHEQLNIIYEVFIKYLAASYHLGLPWDWSLDKNKQTSIKNANNKQRIVQNNTRKKIFYDLKKTRTPLKLRRSPKKVKLLLDKKYVVAYNSSPPPAFPLAEKRLKDGSLLLTTDVSNCNELILWLFHWGGNIEILEPQWFKTKLNDFCNNVIKSSNNNYITKLVTNKQSTVII